MNEYVHTLDWLRQDYGETDKTNAVERSIELAHTLIHARSSRRLTWPDRAVVELLADC